MNVHFAHVRRPLFAWRSPLTEEDEENDRHLSVMLFYCLMGRYDLLKNNKNKNLKVLIQKIPIILSKKKLSLTMTFSVLIENDHQTVTLT